MVTFRYRAYGVRGELAEGSIDAASQDAANDLLWTQGLTSFEMHLIDRSPEPWWKRDLFVGGGPNQAELASFTREFATLNAAEVPLDDALRIVAEQQTTPGMRKVVAEVLAEVLNGRTLSDAMQKHPKVFSADYLSVVRAGEIGSTLGQVFEELADLLDRRMELRARTQSLLIYPAVLIVLTLVSLAIIVGGLIPSIAPIFAESGKPMPASMGMLVTLQAHWMEISVLILLVGGGLGIAAVVALRRPEIRLAFDRFKLKIPSLGPLMLQQETARFARTLGTLLKAAFHCCKRPLRPAVCW
jgi:general secretion pathway protein F